jgi:SAM-dependent methyltransferase
MINSIDSKIQLEKDSQIIKNKTFLKNIYIDFYKRIIPKNIPQGPIIEIGSGGGFLKEIIPSVVTSDVIKTPNIDKVFLAENMPFKNNSVAAFVMVDVLHHIKNSKKALREMIRCLIVNGKIVMIEPYNSLLGKIIYKYIHREHYDPNSGWKIKGKGRLSNSNSALAWIIFIRDREIFTRKFPNLKILRITPHTPFAYLISGGLTKYQFLPGFTYPLVKFVENTIAFLNPYLGMFVTIEIKKVK